MAAVAQGTEQIGTDRRVVLDQQQVGHGCTVTRVPARAARLYRPLSSRRACLSLRPGIVEDMARRLIVTAGWLAAAFLAVLVGLLAISVIGDGLTSQSARPLSEAEVTRELTGVTASPAPASAAIGPSPTPSAAAARTFPTRAGTVVGRCAGNRAEIVTVSPAQGYSVHERDTGLRDDNAEAEFRGISDDHDRLKVNIVCPGGKPDLVVERDED
jgi:hypothetical protein